MPIQLTPTSGYQWANISGTASGTAVIVDRSCILGGVYIPATTTGTITFYDSNVGTSNKSLSVVNNTGTTPAVIDLGMQMSQGLAYTIGGTTNIVVIWN